MPYFVPILNIKPMGFADGSVWNASEGVKEVSTVLGL